MLCTVTVLKATRIFQKILIYLRSDLVCQQFFKYFKNNWQNANETIISSDPLKSFLKNVNDVCIFKNRLKLSLINTLVEKFDVYLEKISDTNLWHIFCLNYNPFPFFLKKKQINSVVCYLKFYWIHCNFKKNGFWGNFLSYELFVKTNSRRAFSFFFNISLFRCCKLVESI